MINPYKDVNWNPGPADRRRFAVALMIGFPAIALLLLVAGFLKSGHLAPAVPVRLGLGGFAAGVVFFLVPAIVRPFYVAWYAVACAIGIVVSNAILGSIFFLAFGGIGLVLRAVGRRPLVVGPDKQAATYWKKARPRPAAEQYLKQS